MAPPRGAAVKDVIEEIDVVIAAKEQHGAIVEEIEVTAKAVEESAAPDPAKLPAHGGMNPVAHRLAANNGTQCGYCSVGFVMNMTEFLYNNPEATKREIEQALDGNLCRCTGYRAILTGMKTFASDWTELDEKKRMKCRLDHEARTQIPASQIMIPFPDGADAPPTPAEQTDGTKTWLAPASLADLVQVMLENPSARLVHANTSYGVYKAEYQEAAERKHRRRHGRRAITARSIR